MAELQCSSTCREELIEKIDDVELGAIKKDGMWKFVTVLFVVITILVGITTRIMSGDAERRDGNIKENAIKIRDAEISLARIQKDLQQLATGQEAITASQGKLEDKLDDLSRILLREIRLSR